MKPRTHSWINSPFGDQMWTNFFEKILKHVPNGRGNEWMCYLLCFGRYHGWFLYFCTHCGYRIRCPLLFFVDELQSKRLSKKIWIERRRKSEEYNDQTHNAVSHSLTSTISPPNNHSPGDWKSRRKWIFQWNKIIEEINAAFHVNEERERETERQRQTRRVVSQYSGHRIYMYLADPQSIGPHGLQFTLTDRLCGRIWVNTFSSSSWNGLPIKSWLIEKSVFHRTVKAFNRFFAIISSKLTNWYLNKLDLSIPSPAKKYLRQFHISQIPQKMFWKVFY